MKNENPIPEHELDAPVEKMERTPLALLPELTMFDAKIIDVQYQYKMYNGAQVYKKNQQTDEFILDIGGNKIPQKEYKITFEVNGFSLPNGKPRQAWLNLNSSIFEDPETHRMSKLLTFLKRLNILMDNPTPRGIINILAGRKVRFMMTNKPNGKQVIAFDTIRSGEGDAVTEVKNLEDIDWKE